MRVFVAICEGPHDAAFIGKVLRSNGYELNTGRVDGFPYPINDMIKSAIKKAAMDVDHIDQGISKPIIPRYVYMGNNSVVCIHSIGGLENTKTIGYYIIDTYELYSEQLELTGNVDNVEGITYLVFCDADNEGVEKRIAQIRQQYGTKYAIPYET